MRTNRRITLICTGVGAPDRSWDTSADAPTHNIMVQGYMVLSHVLHGGLNQFEHDVDRAIIDRAGSPGSFLDLLANLPSAFMGDLLFIRDDEGGYLSATGRGGDRVLYSLTPEDVAFYMSANGLVRQLPAEIRMTA